MAKGSVTQEQVERARAYKLVTDPQPYTLKEISTLTGICEARLQRLFHQYAAKDDHAAMIALNQM